jgi:HPt (histidine-containing phosphotransfer) domain-containing protein
MDGYLLKPVRRRDLLGAVRQWSAGVPADAGQAACREEGADEAPSLDIESVLGEFEGKESVLYGAVDRFLESVRGQIVEMRKAADEGDGASIATDAHSIKGAARFIAAEKMASLALDLEKMGRSAQLDDVRVLLDRMIQETSRVEEILEQSRRGE